MLNVLFAQASDAAASTEGLKALGSIGDVVVFFLFLAAVIFVAFGMSKGSDGNATEYFLAKRSLKWWLIGFSLIAATISAEPFVGMSGQGSDYIGLAVASYEWIAALSLVIVAFFFLPRFLKAGIYTIPEYLEKRYNKYARLIMSIMMMIMLVVVNITVVTYAGAKAYAGFFGDSVVCGVHLNLNFFCWVIAVIAACYIFAGGLKACAWADLLQGSALIVAGGVVLYFSMKHLGSADVEVLIQNAGTRGAELADELVGADAWERFNALNAHKLRMNLPSWDLIIPVTALMLAIWIPNLYYWGLNQYSIQRTLGSKTLGEGQKGLVFAAFMKLLIPFIVIFPGMIAFNLFAGDQHDSAHKASSEELSRFESLKDAPTTEEPLFTFSRSFAAYDENVAQAILEYDVAALGVDEIPAVEDEEKMLAADRLEQKLIAIKGLPEADDVAFSSKTISGYDTDSALSLLMSKVVPTGGFKGFMLAALLGAIISSVAAMLNAASTIFTMDLYNEFTPKAVDKESETKRQKKLVKVGRWAVVVFALIGCLVAPVWNDPKYGGVFKAIQEFQGYISPGIFAAFVIGFWMKKAPNFYGVIALVGCPILYGALAIYCPSLDFLNRMAVTFGVLIGIAFILRVVAPRKEAFVQLAPELPTDADVQAELNAALASVQSENEKAWITEAFSYKMTVEKFNNVFLKSSQGAKIFGIVVVILTILLYLYYWDWESPMF
ncbi:MAG: hypothetical protein J6X44_02170 [Thermoguttaceae bacterium]|nr:hypothetical protein [Thermoguttaceae bacterium]